MGEDFRGVQLGRVILTRNEGAPDVRDLFKLVLDQVLHEGLHLVLSERVPLRAATPHPCRPAEDSLRRPSDRRSAEVAPGTGAERGGGLPCALPEEAGEDDWTRETEPFTDRGAGQIAVHE